MKSLWSAGMALSMCAVLAGSAFGQSADVTLAQRDEGGVVEATFVLSRPTQSLRFPEGGTMRRLSWRFAGTAGTARMAPDGQSITFDKPVRRFTVEMRPGVKDGQIDRAYIPVMSLNGGRSAAVYADYLLPRDGGTVRVAGEGAAFGRHVQHRRPMRKPWVVAGYEPDDAAGQPPIWGDVSGHVVRLSLAGASWQQESVGQARSLDLFIAHELAHLKRSILHQSLESQKC